MTAGQPIAGATVTLYAAATGTPTQLAQGKADDAGAFTLSYGDTPAGSILYVVAKAGAPKAEASQRERDEVPKPQPSRE